MRSHTVGSRGASSDQRAGLQGWGGAALIQGPLFTWSPWLHAALLVKVIFHEINHACLQLPLLRPLEHRSPLGIVGAAIFNIGF